MSRDLPFDEDDSGAGDHAGDTAYHIATGVARVARAGAYVTGGALIAANGSPAPANESHNSRITGWASADPQPDAPSPVVSYPDPEPGSAPPPVLGKHVPAPVSAPLAPAHPEPAAGPFGLPELNGTMAEGAPNLEIPATGNSALGEHSPAMGLPSLDNSTGSDAPFGIPGVEHGTSGFELPSLPTHPAHGPGGFDLPGLDAHPAALPLNHGLGLPGTNGLNLPGMNGLGPGGLGLPESGVQEHSPFDGAGGGHPGMFLGTEMKIDAHIGLDGVWFTSEAKIDFAVGDVGHQLDDYSHWLGSGIHHIPTGDGSQGVPDLVAGLGHPAAPNAVGGPMAAGSHGPHGHAVGAHAAPAHGSAPLGSSSGASSGSTAPGTPVGAPAPQPVSVAPASQAPAFTAAPTPAVAVVPAAPAPVAVSAPVANVAVAQPFTPPAPALAPVAATPLQTSSAPEVASHPIAAVLPTHAGPAVAVPVIAGGHGSDATKVTTSPSSTAGKTTADHPSTSTAPMSQPQTDVEKPSSVPHVSIPPTSVTRPGDATTTTGDMSTGHTGGVTTTRPGDSTSTRPGDTSTRPSDSTDPTTPATGTGGTTGSTPTGTHDPDAGATPPATGNTGHGPTGTEPTAPHPTVPTGHDTPTVPGHGPSAPTTPVTVSPNSGDVGGVGGGAGVHPVPVEPPHTVTPPVGGGGVAPTQVPVKPVAHVVDAYDHSPWVDDHSTLTVAAGGALSSQLLPDATYAELHHPVLHPVADMHITL